MTKLEYANEYILTAAGRKRIKAIAREMNRAHRVCKRQCMEMARQEVLNWAEKFAPVK